MKVGILTFHFACNYGAVLQCYALQSFLEASGHEVRVIDYRPKAVADGYRWFDIRRFWGKTPAKFFRKTSSELRIIGNRRRRYMAFDEFVYGNLYLSIPVQTPEDMVKLSNEFDIIVVGSDQVWNRRLTCGTDPIYWGDFERLSHTSIVSYAASMEDGFDKDTESSVKRLLARFDALSVREDSLRKELLRCIPDARVKTVVDPVLLLDEFQWEKIAPVSRIEVPYLLYYQVRRSERAYEMAKHVAQDKGLKLICISAKVELENSPEAITASPSEFVSLFKNASFVLTTSFHGTVFSVIFRKEFVCVAVDDGRNTRQDNLLNALELKERNVRDLSGIPSEEIDWNKVDACKSRMLEESYEYLKSCGL